MESIFFGVSWQHRLVVQLCSVLFQLYRDSVKAGDTATVGDNKSAKPAESKPTVTVKAWAAHSDNGMDKAKHKPDGSHHSSCPVYSGSAGKSTKPKARAGSTGAKSDTTENRRSGFPQRSRVKKFVTTKTRNSTSGFPVEGSKKQITPKSATLVSGRTKVDYELSNLQYF